MSMIEKVYRKVKLSERLPPLDVFVPMIDDHGEIIIYRRIQHKYYSEDTRNFTQLREAYSMRDLSGDHTPNDNHPMIYWLEEVTIDELITSSERLKYLVDVLRSE